MTSRITRVRREHQCRFGKKVRRDQTGARKKRARKDEAICPHRRKRGAKPQTLGTLRSRGADAIELLPDPDPGT